MCGIAGFWAPKATTSRASLEAITTRMTDAISHRGPDASGVWARAKDGVALGHRRLSIIDLSPGGAQPMTSRDKRYVIVFNGEVYNFDELRKELDGPWRGHSDTEVVLESIAKWGVERAVTKFNGMFAFALWDREEHRLTLVRDRLGIKPLYWGKSNGTWLFASEPKALEAHPDFDSDVDRSALCAYMRFNCVPAPLSMWAGIQQLEPGCLVHLTESGSRIVRYWSARNVAESGLKSPFVGSPDDAVNALERHLQNAVQRRMVSDVPLGAFLSGGIDSSTVVALMQAASTNPVKTFSIGFHDEGYNEATHAAEVAAHLGTDHTELYVTPEQALDVVDDLANMYCEPFSDSSQIPTFLVSQLARQHVTVSLSGDGGDELFAGYNRHIFAPKVWNASSRVPLGLRKLANTAIDSVPSRTWDRVFDTMSISDKVRLPTEKLQKLSKVLPSTSSADMYARLASHWEPMGVVIGGRESYKPGTFDHGSFSEQMMLLDMENYLPNDILTKVDRASMAVSLEARVPLLDHEVVEFAWSLPLDVKLRDGKSKWVLREVLYRHVPKSLIERPKMGFGVPIDQWLRGPLKDWAYELIRPERLRNEGFFHPEPILRRWDEHQTKTRNWQHHLWDVLMFQSWRDAR